MSPTDKEIDEMILGDEEDSQTETETERQEQAETAVDEKTTDEKAVDGTEQQTEEAIDVDLAQEALDATEEPTEQETEADPKDAVIGGFRRDLREAKQEIAELKSKQTAPPTSKSPLELAAIEQDRSVDDVVVDGKLYLDQKAYEDQQAQQVTQQQELQVYEDSANLAYATMTDAVMGKGLSLDTLSQMGGNLLTTGDKLDIIKSGKNCGNETHDRLKYRILQAGGPNADILRSNLKAKRTHQKAKPENKQQETDQKKSVSSDVEDEPELRAATEQIVEDLWP